MHFHADFWSENVTLFPVYIMRTIPDVSPLFQPLEDVIHLKLIPSLAGHSACSTLEREALSLPCHLGGLGI